ncbi:MAG: hypothetical protein V3U73_00830 [bacterium]
MHKKKLILIVILIFSGSSVIANEKSSKKEIPQIPGVLSQELYGKPFLSLDQTIFLPSYAQDLEAQQNVSLKSPKKGLLFSLLLPGSGELYARSWIKGIFFLGVEVAAWTTYSSNHSKGKDLEREFEAYANEYWSRERWESWWKSQPDVTQQQFAHHTLPETNTQQYYEMIGKYQKFNAGWKDVALASAFSDTSAKGVHYMSIRGDSNDKLKLATAMTGIALANHVLSALDAVWSVSRFNKNVKPSMRVKYTVIDGRPTAMANFRLSW